MSKTISAGIVTAYGAAVRGGYTGTYAQFCEALGQLAQVLEDFEGFSVEVTTLEAGSPATADYHDGVLYLGIPQGQKGDPGAKGDPGSKGDPGAKGDPGNNGVSPEVTITTITGGHRVTITDADHPTGQSFDVMDGEDGASDAGEVTFDPTQTYPDGSLGKVVSNESNAISQLESEVVTDVTVTGTIVTITAEANKRYLCGTVSTIDVTPCAVGAFDLIFTSGTTAAVLTIPNTVKWQDSSFDPTALDTSTTYEISVADGTLGLVASWT